MVLHEQIDVRHFYDRWGPTVLRFCQLYLGDVDHAESATREAFVEFFKGASDLKGDKLPIALWRLAVKASRSRCVVLDQGNGPKGFGSCVRLLPCQQRYVFLLKGTLGLTAQEVAETTNTTLSDVKQLWVEALKSLRRLWLKR